MSDYPVGPLGVLIVEDEAVLAMDIEGIVEDTGHRVVGEAASFRHVEALDVELAPHIAFVDIHLADGSSGLDVATLIRDRWPGTLIIFVTANPDALPDNYANGHGVIAKPFSRAGLASAMMYIAESISDPPPKLAQPESFRPSPSFSAAWA